MDKIQLTPEERFLKDGDRSAGLIPVDVHEPVMKALGLGADLPAAEEQISPPTGETPNIMRRLEAEAGTMQRRKRILRIPIQGWAAALFIIVLLGGGYTRYSGELRQGSQFQYKVLPYKPIPATNSGGMIMKPDEPLIPWPAQAQTSKEDELYKMKYSQGYSAIETLLHSGEFATYVIKREDRDEQAHLGLYCPPIIVKDYSAYMASVEKYHAPEVKQPGDMPEGYTLDEAVIKPSLIKVEDDKQFEGEGEIDLGDGFRLTWKREKAENIAYDSSTLVYKKGKNQVRISASRVDENTDLAESLLWTETTKVENIDIGGKQLIYLEPSGNEKIDLGYKYRMVWSDPEEQIIYNMSVRQEKAELTKDEVIHIAAGMIN
ncbi:hypothetical protein R70723_09315 [Paenibacillus sp. FSL R7-0273]|uniref:DUF4367 domain-containing protein n=1 Tax=Paenibacillus sp. FSL R7-0273 TaxID=1536772 RepID=UPI0004F7E245|nr:DUF4367 domain-containing protein [Paenibacillus sp. FSL R7-0273]AIQ46061.1 hypothetical protein R70723_09315 [Paenibacillus sp. FSL R7-0273]OMF92811.1 hypothetical protein BK144_12780 [Paenibacillus sp. FSL R7-0273]